MVPERVVPKQKYGTFICLELKNAKNLSTVKYWIDSTQVQTHTCSVKSSCGLHLYLKQRLSLTTLAWKSTTETTLSELAGRIWSIRLFLSDECMGVRQGNTQLLMNAWTVNQWKDPVIYQTIKVIPPWSKLFLSRLMFGHRGYMSNDRHHRGFMDMTRHLIDWTL